MQILIDKDKLDLLQAYIREQAKIIEQQRQAIQRLGELLHDQEPNQ